MNQTQRALRSVLPRTTIAIVLALAFGVLGGATTVGAAPRAVVDRVDYQLHMVLFSHEAGLSTVIDPQMFVASPGTPAGIRPQGISHVAGVAPAPMADAPSTPLLNADGAPLEVTLGAWEAARGQATLGCQNGRGVVASQFQHLVPGGVYSLFVVHFAVQGTGRFAPLGAADGSDNSFVANPAGHGVKMVRTSPCLTPSAEGVVLVWHSDGMARGPSIGTPGITAHNQLIFRVP